MMRLLIIDAADGHWLTIDAGRIVARGMGLDSPAVDGATLVAVPGDAVVLHWVALPALAPAQGQAAARLLAADVSAAAVDGLHVALGPIGDDGRRVLALVDRSVMAGWCRQLAAVGVVADTIVPWPLLLPIADSGVTVSDDGPLWSVRADGMAFAAEPGLAALLIGDAPRHFVSVDDIAAAAMAPTAIDLQQGEFGPQRQWPITAASLRRLGWLGLAIVAVLLASSLADLWRSDQAAAHAKAALADAAQGLLPPGTLIEDPRRQVAARLAQLGGGGGFAGLAGPVLMILRDRPAAAVQALRYDPAAGLVLVVPIGDAAGLATALGGVGLIVTPASQPGTATAELTVRRR